MRGLINLPPEVLELVYHYLENIDDVHSFGRACSTTYHVIKRQTVYTEIMRSIIGRSWQHRYDIQLCNTLRLHGDVVRHFQQGGSPFPVSASQPILSGEDYTDWEKALAMTTVTPKCASGACTTCLPDAVVYEILARYQGLRTLEDMWLRRQFEDPDLLAADASQDEKEFLRRYACLLGRAQDFEQGDLEARSMMDPATHGYTCLNADQRGRFYSAVTFIWILNEIRWMLTNFLYPTQTYRHTALLDCCKANLTTLCHNHILDQLDQFAVFTFMYHHLLPLHSPVLQDQDSSKLPLTFNIERGEDATQSSQFLQLFLLAGQTYFQPPDLIDLAVRHKASHSAPYPHMELPSTTEQWIRPSNTSPFPANIAFDDLRYKSMFVRLSNTHVSIINRSSFAQIQTNVIRHASRRALSTTSAISDHAKRYFVDSAVAAIERGEDYREDTRPVGDVFPDKWQRNGMWSVWWWANSEGKARAILERWREQPKSLRDQES